MLSFLTSPTKDNHTGSSVFRFQTLVSPTAQQVWCPTTVAVCRRNLVLLCHLTVSTCRASDYAFEFTGLSFKYLPAFSWRGAGTVDMLSNAWTHMCSIPALLLCTLVDKESRFYTGHVVIRSGSSRLSGYLSAVVLVLTWLQNNSIKVDSAPLNE